MQRQSGSGVSLFIHSVGGSGVLRAVALINARDGPIGDQSKVPGRD